MTIKFIHIEDEGSLGFKGTRDEVTVTTHAVELCNVIEAFERFLKGVGYTFEGHLDFVDDLGDIPFEDDDVSFPLERP